MLIHVSSHSVALKREWSRPTIQRLLESRRPGQDYRIPASRRSVSGYASRYKSVMNSRRFTDHLVGPSRSILSKVLPAPPVLPTEDSTPQNGKRLLHLSHVRRNEMSARRRKFFLRRLPKTGHPLPREQSSSRRK